jgi:hypothetical protein
MRLKLLIVTAVLFTTAQVWAHHGSTGYDQNKPLHFAGKISKVDWANPHVVIHVEVTGADANVATWLVNTVPPNAAKRLGFPESSFATGTEVTVDGYQALDGSNHVNGTDIVFKDGKKIHSADCFAPNQPCFRPSDSFK